SSSYISTTDDYFKQFCGSEQNITANLTTTTQSILRLLLSSTQVSKNSCSGYSLSRASNTKLCSHIQSAIVGGSNNTVNGHLSFQVFFLHIVALSLTFQFRGNSLSNNSFTFATKCTNTSKFFTANRFNNWVV